MGRFECVNLSGIWRLWWVENEAFARYCGGVGTAAELEGTGWKSVPVKVPGAFETDLEAAGLIPNPFFGINPVKLRKFEYVYMFYGREFEFYGETENAFLCFDGIDTFADIYLNGILFAKTDNMLIMHEFPCTEIKQGKNEILVHIRPAVIEARKFELAPVNRALKYNYGSLHVRKAPHMYGWDIMPRIVSGGIWRDARVEIRPSERIKDVFFALRRPDFEKKIATLAVTYNLNIASDSLDGYRVDVRGMCGDSDFEGGEALWHTSGRLNIPVSGCRFWYPRNCGAPDMYDAEVTLSRDGKVLDVFSIRIGLRSAELIRTSTTDAQGSGEFVIKINGERIFAMGTNHVPLDAFHWRDESRLEGLFELLDDTGCNIVRCWGGNVYESDRFYDMCDERGIMVWQDFAMACAAYPQDAEFSRKLETEIVGTVKRLRGHPSVVLWAGDNECDECGGFNDPNDNVITRRFLPELVRIYDGTRPYLPSSLYIDECAHASKKPTPEDHLWGSRDYFKGDFYKNSVCHFASETGYHGCPSPASLAKFISKDKLWPPENNEEWLAHAASPEIDFSGSYAYRIGLMTRQVETLFGSVPDNLEEYALASQISQAEAKKYFIERFRMFKWRRTGIIWWNMLDGWPQISDAVVDYYFDKKLAYYYIKRSQQPFCLMLGEPENGLLTLYAVNDTRKDVKTAFTVTDLTDGKVLLSDCAVSLSDESVAVGQVKNPEGQHFLLIKWEGGKNHYMANMPGIELEEYVKLARQAGIMG